MAPADSVIHRGTMVANDHAGVELNSHRMPGKPAPPVTRISIKVITLPVQFWRWLATSQMSGPGGPSRICQRSHFINLTFAHKVY